MMLLQAVADSTNRAPDATGLFWGVSEVLITLVIFVGVYFIFKPVFGHKEEDK
ncbi:hypothetical protein N9J07_03180 [Bacteroidia bacterium]|nr:hypothetical protein [Bacteroidia bacterium]